MKQLKDIWFIALKDLKLFVLDRTTFFMFVIFPLLFITLFSQLNESVTKDTRLELHVATMEKKSGISRQIIESIRTKKDAKLKPGQPEIIWDRNYKKAKQAVKNKKIDGVLVFPTNFTEAVMMGYGANLKVVADAEAVQTAAALKGLAQGISSQVGAMRTVDNATLGLVVEKGFSSGALEQIGPQVGRIMSQGQNQTGQESFINFKTVQVGKKAADNPSDWVVSGYLVMFVFFAGAQAAEMIVQERQNLTLERLLASSVRKESILGGIFTGGMIKGLLQIFIFWMAGVLIFKADLGEAPIAIILVSVLMVIASAAFGVMLATFVKTKRSASSAAVLASLVFAALGGCWWPLFITPKWMQFMAKITPHAWANSAFNKLMLFSGDFDSVLPEMAALIGFTFLFAIIAVIRFSVSAVDGE